MMSKRKARLAWEVRSNAVKKGPGLRPRFRYQIWLRDGPLRKGLGARYAARSLAEQHAAKLSVVRTDRHRFELRIRARPDTSRHSILWATHPNPLQKEGAARLAWSGIHEWEVIAHLDDGTVYSVASGGDR